EHFVPETLIGLTATDERFDEKSLETVFGSYETSLTLQQAIDQELLPPVRAFRVETNIDLSAVRYNGVDYVQHDLQRTLVVPSRDRIVVDVLTRYFGETRLKKQGVVFCVNVAHAERMAGFLCQVGISAEAVSGRNRVRAEKSIEGYREGRVQFLCACDLLT